jgi:hypothetical protein
MFFNGFPSKGSCPAGGANEAAGFNFVLPHVDPNNATFDSGNLTTPGGLTLNGSVHIVMRRNGDFAFSSHAHDSGFDNIDYVVSAVVMTTTGIPFTFQHEGHVEGTIAGLPFGKPKRDDNFDMSGHNPMISREFDGMDGAVLVASVDGIDTLVGGLKRALEDLLKEAGDELKKAATAAVVALVVA